MMFILNLCVTFDVPRGSGANLPFTHQVPSFRVTDTSILAHNAPTHPPNRTTMSPGNDSAGPNKRIQSLVQLCQRVAGNHIESISSLGELPFTLVRPILDRCSAEQLLRVEDASPHLKRDSEELWRALCRRTYPAMVERYGDGTDTSPDSWRSRFFVLREAEATRLEEVGSRLRLQRLEADERKKEREIKLTDRLPPPKRQRTGWNMSAPSKTLFQKTRSEASKLQKNMYHTRMIPPMLKGKDYSPTGSISNRSPLPAQSKYSTRVVVNTVIRRPSSSSASSSEPAALPSKTLNASPSKPVALPSTWRAENRPLSSSRNDAMTRKHTPQNSPISTPEIVPPLPKSFSLAKKDPMASLFVPKHRAYSQRAR